MKKIFIALALVLILAACKNPSELVPIGETSVGINKSYVLPSPTPLNGQDQEEINKIKKEYKENAK